MLVPVLEELEDDDELEEEDEELEGGGGGREERGEQVFPQCCFNTLSENFLRETRLFWDLGRTLTEHVSVRVRVDPSLSAATKQALILVLMADFHGRDRGP